MSIDFTGETLGSTITIATSGSVKSPLLTWTLISQQIIDYQFYHSGLNGILISDTPPTNGQVLTYISR